MNKSLPIARVLFPLFLIPMAASCARTTDLKPVEPPVRPNTTTLALGSCAHQERVQKFWEHIEAHKPELFLFMGDNVYGDVRDHGKASMPELGLAYAMLSTHPEFEAFRAKVPILPTWDDHDYACGDCGADFPLRKEAESHFENFWGLTSDDPRTQRPGVYFSQMHESHGKKIQIIVLDTRYFRSELTPSPDTTRKGAERFIPSKAKDQDMLGKAQWSWLEAEIQKTADLRIVVSSIQVLAEDHGFESWRNLPDQRKRLLKLLTNKPNAPVLIVSGDRHMGAFYRKEVGDAELYEFTSSALNIATNLRPKEFSSPQITPYFPEPNFGLIRVHWASGEVRLLLYSNQGHLLHQHNVTLDDLRGGS